MGIFDDLKDAADKHEDQVEQGIDKVGDLIDEKTGGKFANEEIGRASCRERV